MFKKSCLRRLLEITLSNLVSCSGFSESIGISPKVRRNAFSIKLYPNLNIDAFTQMVTKLAYFFKKVQSETKRIFKQSEGQHPFWFAYNLDKILKYCKV